MTTIRLPLSDGRFEDYRIKNGPLEPVSASTQSGNASRIAYSAVHVVANPLADNDPWLDAAIDWDEDGRVPQLHLGLRPRRRRSDGYRAARHGRGLADGA